MTGRTGVVRGLGRTGLTTEQSQYLAGDVARIDVRGEKNVRRRYLLRLARALHRHLGPMLRRLLRRLVHDVERGPDRTGRNTIHPDPSLDQILRQRLGEGVDGPLRRRIVE